MTQLDLFQNQTIKRFLTLETAIIGNDYEKNDFFRKIKTTITRW